MSDLATESAAQGPKVLRRCLRQKGEYLRRKVSIFEEAQHLRRRSPFRHEHVLNTFGNCGNCDAS